MTLDLRIIALLFTRISIVHSFLSEASVATHQKEGNHKTPKGHPEAPRSYPGGTQETPRGTQKASRRHPEAHRGSHRTRGELEMKCDKAIMSDHCRWKTNQFRLRVAKLRITKSKKSARKRAAAGAAADAVTQPGPLRGSARTSTDISIRETKRIITHHCAHMWPAL